MYLLVNLPFFAFSEAVYPLIKIDFAFFMRALFWTSVLYKGQELSVLLFKTSFLKDRLRMETVTERWSEGLLYPMKHNLCYDERVGLVLLNSGHWLWEFHLYRVMFILLQWDFTLILWTSMTSCRVHLSFSLCLSVSWQSTWALYLTTPFSCEYIHTAQSWVPV